MLKIPHSSGSSWSLNSLHWEHIWDKKTNNKRLATVPMGSIFHFPPAASRSCVSPTGRATAYLPYEAHLILSTFSTDLTHTPLLGKGTDASAVALLQRDAGRSGLLGRLFLISSCFTLSLCRRSWLAWRNLRCSDSILWTCPPIKPEEGWTAWMEVWIEEADMGKKQKTNNITLSDDFS